MASSKDTVNSPTDSRGTAPLSTEDILNRDTAADMVGNLRVMADTSSRRRLRGVGLVLGEVRLWGWAEVCWVACYLEKPWMGEMGAVMVAMEVEVEVTMVEEEEPSKQDC